MFSPLEQFDVINFYPIIFILPTLSLPLHYDMAMISWYLIYSPWSVNVLRDKSFVLSDHLDTLHQHSDGSLMYLDISLTNLSFYHVYISCFLLSFFYLLSHRKFLIPNNFQVVLESLILFMVSLVSQQVGKKGYAYVPFFFFIFVYILSANLISMLPFSFAATSHVFWVFFLSLSMCLGVFLTGLMVHKLTVFKLFVPEVPLALYPLMIVLELASYFIKSLSLGIRLGANLISGHTLMHIFIGVLEALPILLVKYFMLVKIIVYGAVLALCFSITFLELGVACLQAYVYVLLLSMYLNDVLHPDSH